jgi:serine/threonine protein kinase
MSAKTVRPGRFKPKCPKCGGIFLLEVSDTQPPTFRTALPPAEAKPVPADEVTEASLPSPAGEVTEASLPGSAASFDATVAPEQGSAIGNADFSVSPSAIGAAAPSGVDTDATLALDQTQPPPNYGAMEETEAGDPSVAAGKQQDVAPSGAMPSQLGGYQILKELGRGGMGAVYLARQMSLDRPVALKVMNPQWAKNPNFLVRFTREAYAAAQLLHHNVVQVYDIGEEAGVHYFSMEFVEGQSLGDLVKKEGKLSPELAAGYILQAARGLKYAHDRGMIHRDIKPDNLMLNTQGVVKVADLGLVRTPGMVEEKPGQEVAPLEVPAAQESTGRSLSSLSGVTLAGQAMGTPSYMAPEQARDATAVDGRADIYSLGCTLFVLATGQPVYKGKTAMEIMTRHATEPVPRPEAVESTIPRALGDIITKMIAKKPDQRYQAMEEVIAVLEDFLGLQAAKASATEQHLRVLENGARAFHASPLARVRGLVLLGIFGGCLALFALLMLTSWWKMGTFFLALGGSTALAYFLVRGSAERGYLFTRVRDFLLGSSWLDWLKMAGITLVAVLGLFLLGLLPYWLVAIPLGIGLAFGLHLGLDKRINMSRKQTIDKVEHMLKTLRLRGLSEEALQDFVSQYAGDHWEEFFEALFGYEAKRDARARFTGKPRPTFAAWREPIVAWIDRVQKARQEARERAHLQRVEQKNLEAQGLSAGEAKARAEQVAQALVAAAAEIKQAEPVAAPEEVTVVAQPGQAAPGQPTAKKTPPRRVNLQELIEVVDQPRPTKAAVSLNIGRLLAAPFGGGPRVLLGCALLLLAGFWVWQNNLLPDQSQLENSRSWVQMYAQAKQVTGKVALPIPAPAPVNQMVFSIGALVAGVLMIVSALWFSWKIGLLQYIATAVLLYGPVSGYMPQTLMGLDAIDLSLIAGAAVSLVGFVFGRDT